MNHSQRFLSSRSKVRGVSRYARAYVKTLRSSVVGISSLFALTPEYPRLPASEMGSYVSLAGPSPRPRRPGAYPENRRAGNTDPRNPSGWRGARIATRSPDRNPCARSHPSRDQEPLARSAVHGRAGRGIRGSRGSPRASGSQRESGGGRRTRHTRGRQQETLSPSTPATSSSVVGGGSARSVHDRGRGDLVRPSSPEPGSRDGTRPVAWDRIPRGRSAPGSEPRARERRYMRS